MSKAYVYRMKPSTEEALKRLADDSGKSKSAYLSDLINSTDPSSLEVENPKNRVTRSLWADDATLEHLAKLCKASGGSRADVVQLLIERELRKHG